MQWISLRASDTVDCIESFRCVGMHWDAMCVSGGSGMPALHYKVTVYVTMLVCQVYALQATIVPDA